MRQARACGQVMLTAAVDVMSPTLPTTRENEPMIKIRRDNEIYSTEGGWFKARWHFSFDTYSDPENDSFGAMRVFNDDRLIPGAVWPLHPHRDVEGLTYVVEGLFGHEDNVGGAVRTAARRVGRNG